MLRALIDMVFPVRSLKGEEGQWITPAEWSAIRGFPVRLERKELKKRGMPSIDRLIAIGTYDQSQLLRKAIWTLKYGRSPAVAAPLGAAMADALLHSGCAGGALCPVPLHWTRRYFRGFNQAELLARYIGLRVSVPVYLLLRRARMTGHQAWRQTRVERRRSLHDAFRWSGTTVPPWVVLVDDVATSGATLEACARVLRQKGVARVEAIVVALG